MSSCTICAEKYDEVTRIPLIGSCGHSLCKSCIDAILKNTPVRGVAACPLCKTVGAFRKLKRNYQMIEVLAETKTALEKSSRAEKIVDEHDLRLLRCHVCSDQIDARKSRICKTCCEKSGHIMTRANGHVIVGTDEEQLDASVLCGYCFLDGHKGHESIPLFPIKMELAVSHSLTGVCKAAVDFVPTFEGKMSESSVARHVFTKPLEDLKKMAKSAGNSAALDEIMSRMGRELDVVDRHTDASYRLLYENKTGLQIQCLDHRLKEMIHAIGSERNSPLNESSAGSPKVFPILDDNNYAERLGSMERFFE